MRRFFLTTSAALAIAAPLAAQTTITTGTPTDHIGPVGKIGATAIAQTFVPSTGMEFLQSFTFFYSTFLNGGALKLDASVYAFSDDHLVGPALFTSVLVSGTDASDDEALTFGTAASPLNIQLTPGTVYALVLSSINGLASSPGDASILVGTAGDATTDAYTGGALFYTFTDNQADLQTAGAFSPGADLGLPDAAFSATFTNAPVSAVPEPGSLVLMATGLIGVAGFVRRRSRSRAV